MAFKINRNTKSDTTEISRAWTDKLRNGLGATMIVAGIASSQANAYAEQVTQPRNLFTQVNNPTDEIHRKEYENTVFITLGADTGKDRLYTLITGSGTIIANSKDEKGHNVILTAGHVAGHLFDKEGSHDVGTICNGKFAKCYAYDSNGNPLGVVRERANAEGINMPNDTLGHHIKNDVTTLSIDPIDKRYDTIQGATIANNLPDRVLKAQVAKNIKNTDDNLTMKIGPDHGLSGGGVYNEKGELISVVSYYKPTIKNEDGTFSVKDEYLGTVSQSGNNIIEKLSDREQIRGILPQNQKDFKDTILDKTRAGEGYLFFPEINSPNIMNSLGNAGKDKSKTQIGNDNISIVGFPWGSAQEYAAKLDNEKEFNDNIEPTEVKEYDPKEDKYKIDKNMTSPEMF